MRSVTRDEEKESVATVRSAIFQRNGSIAPAKEPIVFLENPAVEADPMSSNMHVGAFVQISLFSLQSSQSSNKSILPPNGVSAIE